MQKHENISPGRLLLLLLVLLSLLLSSCGDSEKESNVPEGSDAEEATLSLMSQDEYQYLYPKEGDLCADISILDYGHIYIKLFKDDAPYAVDNFVTLAKKGRYNGTLVSAAVKDYYLQCGRPMTSEEKEESIWGGGFSNEISERLYPTRGSVCMANQGGNDSNAMQFFFTAGSAKTIQGLEAPLQERYGLSLKDYLKKNYQTELNDSQLNRFMLYGGAPWLYGHHTVFGQVFKGYDVMDSVIAAAVAGNDTIYINKISIYEYVKL